MISISISISWLVFREELLLKCKDLDYWNITSQCIHTCTTSCSTAVNNIARESGEKLHHPYKKIFLKQFMKTNSALSCKNKAEACSFCSLEILIREQEWSKAGKSDGHETTLSVLQKRIIQLQAACSTSGLYEMSRPNAEASAAAFKSESTTVEESRSSKTLYQRSKITESPTSALHFPTDQKLLIPTSNGKSSAFSPLKDDTALLLIILLSTSKMRRQLSLFGFKHSRSNVGKSWLYIKFNSCFPEFSVKLSRAFKPISCA